MYVCTYIVCVMLCECVCVCMTLCVCVSVCAGLTCAAAIHGSCVLVFRGARRMAVHDVTRMCHSLVCV